MCRIGRQYWVNDMLRSCYIWTFLLFINVTLIADTEIKSRIRLNSASIFCLKHFKIGLYWTTPPQCANMKLKRGHTWHYGPKNYFSAVYIIDYGCALRLKIFTSQISYWLRSGWFTTLPDFDESTKSNEKIIPNQHSTTWAVIRHSNSPIQSMA